MKFTVRAMGDADRGAWIDMRSALWPDTISDAHEREVDELLASEDSWGFIAETVDGAPVGFAEIAIRKYANGCTARPVPFLEGVWIRDEFRRQGIAAQLIAHAGTFLAARGFCEICSDSEIHNYPAYAAHMRWGFSETERVVYFRKSLIGPA